MTLCCNPLKNSGHYALKFLQHSKTLKFATQCIYPHILPRLLPPPSLLLLPLHPTVCFSPLSDFLPFRPFLTQLSPSSYSHYMYIFFDALNPSFPWSSSVSPTCWFTLQYSFRYSFSFHPHHVTQPSHSFVFTNLTISVFFIGSFSS